MNESNLHNYQNRIQSHVIENPHCGLFVDMGLGKTVSVLSAINRLMYQELDVASVLVIAPKRVVESVWPTEVRKWDHLKHLTVLPIIGTEKKRKMALATKVDIHLISRDNIAWLCGQFGGSMLPFDMLVIDESSSFKSPKSQRFKALRKVQPSFDRVVLLTGTPAPNGLIDLWSQIFLLDRGERLGKTISAYRNDYFSPGARNGAIIYNYNLRKNGEERIHAKIEDICISMKAEDYLELPPVIYNDVNLRFDAKLQKAYNDFERDMVLELFSDGEEIAAVNAAALSGKLQQFADGAIYDADREYHDVHDLKLKAAEEIVESAQGKPVLIAYSFLHSKAALLKGLKKYDPVVLKTDQDIEDWNAGKIKVMLLHPASGGHGLNLQYGGHILIWYGQNWSLELYQQLNKRLDRQGQKQSVIINRLIAQSTIDEDIIKSLASKDVKQESLMQAVKLRIAKYL